MIRANDSQVAIIRLVVVGSATAASRPGRLGVDRQTAVQTLAVQSRRTLGYTNVAHLDGGLKARAEHGRPITHHAPS